MMQWQSPLILPSHMGTLVHFPQNLFTFQFKIDAKKSFWENYFWAQKIFFALKKVNQCAIVRWSESF